MSGTTYGYTGSAWQPLKADATSGALFTGLWVWSGSAWVQMTQPVDVTQDGTIVVPAQVEIDIFHYAVHASLGFETSSHIAVASGATMAIGFKTPAVGTQIHILPDFVVEAEAVFQIREACTFTTSGSSLLAGNRNRRSDTPPVTAMENMSGGTWIAGSVTKDPTVDAAGTIINGGGGGEQIGIGRKVGGSSDAAHEWVLRPATIYNFEIKDLSSAENECTLNLSWFEVPDAA